MSNEKKIHLKDIISGYSDLITAHSKLSGMYKHPSGTGDGREDALMEVLKVALPDNLGAEKCTIIDCEGNATNEFDIVIFEKSYCITPLHTAGRKVIPIESVYAVIEVKSYLNQKAYDQFTDAVCSLNNLTRFYKPIGYHPPNQFTQQHRDTLKKGIKAQQTFPTESNMPRIGHIMSAIFCYDAVASTEISKYLNQRLEGLTWICVHERELIYRWMKPEGFKLLPIGKYSIGLLLWQLMPLLSSSNRSLYYKPDFKRYHDNLTLQILGEHGVEGLTIEL